MLHIAEMGLIQGTGTGTGGAGMSYFSWIVLGLISGFIASKLVNKRGEGLLLDIVLGIVGALVGGYASVRLLGIRVTGVNLTSLLIAIIGAVIVLVVYHAIRRTV